MRRFFIAAVYCFSTMTTAAAEPKEWQALQDAVHKVVDDVKPSIAGILVSRSERYRDFDALPAGPEGKLGDFKPPAPQMGDTASRRELVRRLDLASGNPIPESYGSGVVVDASGLILTPFHVVQNATKVYVRVPDATAKRGYAGSYADILAADGRADLAVLKLIDPPANLKAVRFGDGGKTRKADFVVGMANPYSAGFPERGPVASYGLINAVVRKGTGNADSPGLKPITDLTPLLQTEFRLNLGCSGGGVFNLDGELVGLTSSTAALNGGESAGDMAVALTPSIKGIVKVLRRGEEVEYGLLGVSVNASLVERFGVLINSVNIGSPAKRSGLREGDIITAVNGMPIKNFDDLSLYVGTAFAGLEATVTVRSIGGQARKVTVKLAKAVNDRPSIAANRPPAVHGLRVDFGSALQVEAPEGVYIRDVERGSAAERKYKELLDRAGWIITDVNGKAVTTPTEFYRECAAVKGPLELKIVEVPRNPETPTRTLTFP